MLSVWKENGSNCMFKFDQSCCKLAGRKKKGLKKTTSVEKLNKLKFEEN